MHTRTLIALAALALAAPAAAQTFDSGSSGALGAFAPTESVVVDLPEDGVLHYTTIDIPEGVTVTFNRNDANTPVYMLATGDVTIGGLVSVNGVQGGGSHNRWWVSRLGGVGGPGGGDGGASRAGTSTVWGQHGTGPGAGAAHNSSGWGQGPSGGASPVGNGGKQPSGPAGGVAPADKSWWLYFGGSGGGAGTDGGGGGGGGVITIASSGTLLLTGEVRANGGAGNFHGASGGAGSVRLVATTVTGTGKLRALAGGTCSNSYSNNGSCGANGIIRIDGFTITGTLTTNASPAPYYGTPTKAVPYPAAKRPTLRLASHDGGDFAFGDPGAHGLSDPPNVLPQNTTTTITVEATWVPPGTEVKVAINSLGGGRTVYTATLAGTVELTTATVDATIPAGKQAGTVEAWIPSLPLPTQ